MPPVRRALVAGGTGLVGGELLGLLAQDTRYSHVTSLVRRVVADTGKWRTEWCRSMTSSDTIFQQSTTRSAVSEQHAAPPEATLLSATSISTM